MISGTSLSRFIEGSNKLLLTEAGNKRRLIFSFLLSAFSLAFVFVFFNIRYQENDDVVMASIASGAYGGSASEYLVFTNVIIGWILKLFYSWNASMNWYTFYILFFHWVALTAIAFSFFVIFKSISRLLLVYFIFFFLLEIRLLQFLQFTTTGGIVAAAGLLLLFTNVKKTNVRFNVQSFLAVLFLLMSGLIRKEVLFLVLIVSGPFLIYRMYVEKLKIILELSMLLLLFIGAIFFDTNYYNQRPEWKYYKAYLNCKLDMQENAYFSDYEEVKYILETVEWNKEDFLLFKSFSSDDSKKYSLENLEKIHSQFQHHRLKSIFTIATVKRFLYDWKSRFNKFVIIVTLVFIFFLANRRHKYFRIILLTFLWGILVISIIDISGAVVKQRVIDVLLLTLYSVFFYALGEQLFWKRWIYCGMIYVFISSVYITHRSSELIIATQKNQQKIFEAVDQFSATRLTFIGPNTIRSECQNPFRMRYLMANYYCVGWLSGIPFNKEKIKRVTGDSDINLQNAFTHASDLQWVLNSATPNSELMNNYLINTYAPDKAQQTNRIKVDEKVELVFYK